MPESVLMIGIGNEFRCDDGVGIHIARALMRRRIPGIEIMALGGEGMTLMDAWAGRETVVIADAIFSSREPGSVIRFDCSANAIPAELFCYSTHAFSLAEAVELSRLMNTLPKRVIVYGVEGRNFQYGRGLTEEVQKGMEMAIEQMVRELGRMTKGKEEQPVFA